jgi:hypothetical protein
MQEKLLLFVLIKCLLYKGVPSAGCNKVSAPSLSLSQILYALLDLLKTRPKKIFYMRGLFELFPPSYLPYSISLALH